MAKAKKRKATAKQLKALAKGRAMKYGRKAPKRKTTTQTRTRMAKKRRSYAKKATPKKGILAKLAPTLGAVGYGMVRQRLSNMVTNSAIGQKLPVTEFTDEAVMLAMNFGARKVGLNKGFMAPVLRAQKQVELARVGQTIVDVMQNKTAMGGAKSKTGYPV
jgi:hypothetical protein